jgi:hypothetical protein
MTSCSVTCFLPLPCALCNTVAVCCSKELHGICQQVWTTFCIHVQTYVKKKMHISLKLRATVHMTAREFQRRFLLTFFYVCVCVCVCVSVYL